MSEDNNGWPNKPGWPLEPEKAGPHWLKGPCDDLFELDGVKFVAYWRRAVGGHWWMDDDELRDVWWFPGNEVEQEPEYVGKNCRYIGPVKEPE